MPPTDRDPSVLVSLPDGRQIAADDVGPRTGRPVLYVHGTPDSRLARHPDDSLLDALDIRLLAVDRPGFGWSSADPTATIASWADDVIVLADHLALPRFAVLAWSAGAMWALGIGAVHPSRVTGITVVGGLVPLPAYQDPAIRVAAGEARTGMVDTASDMGATEAAELIAPMLVPDPPTFELALEHLMATHDSVTAAEFASVPGGDRQMAQAMLDAVRGGSAGLVRDLAVQLSPPDVTLASVTCPVHLIHGGLDTACPPAFGAWFAAQLPDARLDVIEGAGHAVLLTRWAEILDHLV